MCLVLQRPWSWLSITRATNALSSVTAAESQLAVPKRAGMHADSIMGEYMSVSCLYGCASKQRICNVLVIVYC